MNTFKNQDVLDKYKSRITDWDTATFLNMFSEPEGSKILEVGAHDEPCANVLTDLGYEVIGVDLREYDEQQPLCNYSYVRCDFCNLPKDFICEHMETFDAIYSISAIEHFGLGTYQEGVPNPTYDIIAMHTMWKMLKEGGSAYITVPFGRDYIVESPHWRVYDLERLHTRIIQDFDVETCVFIAAEPVVIGRRYYPAGQKISLDSANKFSGVPPHVTVCLKLKKSSMKRLAPNGR